MNRPSFEERIRIGPQSDFDEGVRRIVDGPDYSIGVFRIDGGFVAYENRCVHQGGPVCEGQYFPRMTAEVDHMGRVLQETYDQSEPHLVCPWHGWEYDLKTGEACAKRSIRLRSFKVELSEGDVYVWVS